MRLSVIIPCYNVERYLPDAVRSLQRNVGEGIEFVFVDDASTDRTAELLQRSVASLPGARLVTNPTNLGLAGSRNAGLDVARGEYLAFLDSDDVVAPRYYQALVAQIEELQVDFVRTDHVRFNGNKRVIDRVRFGPRRRPADPRTGILPADRNTSVDYPYAWAGIFHRRLRESGLLYFTQGLRTCEDRPWIWRLHLHAESMAAVNLLGVLYRRNVGNSLSQVADTRQFDFIRAFDQIVADAAADRNRDDYLPKAVRSYAAMVCHHLSRIDRYEPGWALTLQSLCRQAVRRLPQAELALVLDDLDTARRLQITELMEAA
jgi:glycosyltransferase involved in cell wall biosynthesis